MAPVSSLPSLMQLFAEAEAAVSVAAPVAAMANALAAPVAAQAAAVPAMAQPHQQQRCCCDCKTHMSCAEFATHAKDCLCAWPSNRLEIECVCQRKHQQMEWPLMARPLRSEAAIF